jgi:hypothetical protein
MTPKEAMSILDPLNWVSCNFKILEDLFGNDNKSNLFT